MEPQTAKSAASRKLSGLVFGGAQYRIEVVAEISARGLVANTAEIAEALELTPQTVNNELRKLEAAGLLQRTEPQGQKVFYVGAKSGLWALCEELQANAVQLLDSVPRY